ncbi:MAG: glycosyl hydrolase-related protein [Treponema sp.]|jgi:alpha-mannosidase|nr:glycosyl hydrolase-related protein [Treponema sp.]
MLTPKVENRITQYLKFLKPLRYREISPLAFEYFETDKTFRAPPEKVQWKKITNQFPYGTPWHCGWFRAGFKSPKAAGKPGRFFLRVIPNADSLVFIDGKPAGAFNSFHHKIAVPADGREHVLHLEAYEGHPYPGMHPFQGRTIMLTLGRQIPDYPNTFEGGSLLERLEPVYSLYYDVKCLFELALSLDNNSLRKARILKGLYDSLMEIPFDGEYLYGGEKRPDEGIEKRALAASKKIAPLLAAKNGTTAPEVHLTGHAHIDHAWLWHIGETERKAARTYMNMAALAREYPEFVFIQSQPCQLEIVKNEYPEIFAVVKETFRKGNWEPNGGMWVEADCNVTGGESLVRQFLVGKAANREMLGSEKGFVEADTLWLPDVFGYAAALPQILAGCRIKYFVTSKINWNDTTRFPYDTFIWRGIDGTGVKTHYISSWSQGYNGRVSPESLKEIWNQVQHKELQGGVVKSIGEGDGGGGTARGDLEEARRLANLEGAPRSGWKKVSAALDSIFKKGGPWPEWRGELYLELHRGTYTTQAKTKMYNRRLEFALRHVEFLAAALALERGLPYPHEQLLENWKRLLTNQFHDIIPGSSIHRVYAEAEAAYRTIETELSQLAGTLRQKLAAGTEGVTIFNDLSWERRDPVSMPAAGLGKITALKSSVVPAASALRGSGGSAGLRALAAQGIYPVQRYRDLDGRETAVFIPFLPAMGWTRFSGTELPSKTDAGGGNLSSPFEYSGKSLKTPFYRVVFDRAGRISALRDTRGKRELVAGGGFFNGFISARDVPVLWEAWDVDSDWTKYLEEETRLVSTSVAADGPVCFILRRQYKIGDASVLTQDTVFYALEKRIDFITKIDWREKRRLLKVSFDTAIDAAQIRCEVQYGHLLRNTHRNLPHDRAKFEICAHKWVSLEETGGGIALLNDSKYGHDVEGGRVRLTLLRSPTAPDEDADRGEQRFIYSILPFTGGFGESRVVRAGYELNAGAVVECNSAAPEPRGRSAKGGTGDYSFFSVDSGGIIAESVKAPETEKGKVKSCVIRLYESLGGKERAVLRFSRNIASAYLTDMLEGNPKPLRTSEKEFALQFRAFEIKTVLVHFR